MKLIYVWVSRLFGLTIKTGIQGKVYEFYFVKKNEEVLYANATDEEKTATEYQSKKVLHGTAGIG